MLKVTPSYKEDYTSDENAESWHRCKEVYYVRWCCRRCEVYRNHQLPDDIGAVVEHCNDHTDYEWSCHSSTLVVREQMRWCDSLFGLCESLP